MQSRTDSLKFQSANKIPPVSSENDRQPTFAGGYNDPGARQSPAGYAVRNAGYAAQGQGLQRSQGNKGRVVRVCKDIMEQMACKTHMRQGMVKLLSRSSCFADAKAPSSRLGQGYDSMMGNGSKGAQPVIQCSARR